MLQTEIIIVPLLIAAIFGMFYISVTARHRQRMAMIEKGLDLSAAGSPPRILQLTLMFGMLMVGLGIGILFGHTLNQLMPMPPTEYDPHPENAAFYFLSILISGGIALIAHHFIVRNKRQG